MRSWLISAVSCWLALTIPLPLYAGMEADVLKVVPDSVLGVLVVHRLKDTSDRIEKLGRDLHVAVPNPLAFAKGLAGVAHGVEEKGSLAIALFSGGDGKPPVGALFIPVHDYSTFLRPLAPKETRAEIARITFFRQPALVTQKAGFAVLVAPGQEELLTTIRAWDSGVDKLVEPLGAWLTTQSIAVVTLERGTTQAVDKLHATIESAEKRLPMGSEFYGSQLAALSAASAGCQQLHGELAQCGLGLQLSDRAAIASVRAAFKADGHIAKAVEQKKWPAADAALSGLPAGDFALVAAGSIPIAVATASVNLKRGVLERAKGPKAVFDAEQIKQFEERVDNLLRHFSTVAVALRPPASDGSWFERALTVMVVDNSKPFLIDYEKYAQSFAQFYNEDQATAGRFSVKQKAIGLMPGLEIAADLSSRVNDPIAPKPPAMDFVDRLIGSTGRLTAHLAAVDEHRVAVSYGREEGILEIVKEISSGRSLDTDSNAKKALALLPDHSNWIVLADFHWMVQLVNTVMPALDASAFPLPEFPESQPAAIGVKLTPREFDARLVVPADLLGKLGGYFVKMRESRQDD